MKKIYTTLVALLTISQLSYAQWLSSGNHIYNSNTGNVGIGITNPTGGKLQINGSTDLLTLSSDGGVAQFNAYNNTDFRIIQRNNGIMTLWTSTIERMRIDASGKVGIGTTDLTEKLTLRDPNIAYDSNSGVVKIRFDSGNGGGGIGFEKESFNTGGLRFYTQYGYGSMLEKMRIASNGNVGIGTSTPDAKLTVNGTIHSKDVTVDMFIFPDYVFLPDYNLPSLKDVKAYIDKKHHLPEVPSAQEVAKDGLKLGEMNAILLKKVEELTLYLIEQQKAIKSLQDQMEKLLTKK